MAHLPIIDIAPYVEAKRDLTKCMATSDALHSACVEYGFFYLDISQYIDPSEPEELTRLAREFFALPQEEKDKIRLENQDYARGISVC
jgi:isopenicillin N synthase-like dioxygenase